MFLPCFSWALLSLLQFRSARQKHDVWTEPYFLLNTAIFFLKKRVRLCEERLVLKKEIWFSLQEGSFHYYCFVDFERDANDDDDGLLTVHPFKRTVPELFTFHGADFFKFGSWAPDGITMIKLFFQFHCTGIVIFTKNGPVFIGFLKRCSWHCPFKWLFAYFNQLN